LRVIDLAAELEAQAREAGKHDTELWAAIMQATGWSNLGENLRALEAYRHLLVLARRYDDKGYMLAATGRFASRAGFIDLRNRWDEIRSLLLEGVETARKLDNRDEEAYHLMRLGAFAVRMKEYDQGVAWLQEALNVVATGSNSDQELWIKSNAFTALSEAMQERGEYKEAAVYAEMASAIAQTAKRPLDIAFAKITLAGTKQGVGELAEALQILDEVLKQVEGRGWQSPEQEAAYHKGEVLRQLSYPSTAIPSARRALELSRQMQKKVDEVKALLSLGQALCEAGEKEEGREVLGEARRLSQERNYADYFSQAEEALQKFN
jgi:tetratricopeptide (TPR) repeat protein